MILSNMVSSQIFNNEVEANIEVNNQGELVRFTFSAYNKTTVQKSLKYSALVIKNATAELEEEKFDEEDYFVMGGEEQKTITQASIKMGENQRTIAFILIYENDKVIGKDRILINGFEGEDNLKPTVLRSLTENISHVTENEVNLLRGMVTEDTKTKPGRDFYQFFFLEYNTKNIKGEKIVKVSEEMAIGGNTQIKIFAGDDMVVQFFINPRASYLKDMAIQSVNMVERHFRLTRAIEQDLIKY